MGTEEKTRGMVKNHSAKDHVRRLCGCTGISLLGGGNAPQGASNTQTLLYLKQEGFQLKPEQLAAATGSWHCPGWERVGNLSLRLSLKHRSHQSQAEFSKWIAVTCAFGKSSCPQLSQGIGFCPSFQSIHQHLDSKSQLPALETWLGEEWILQTCHSRVWDSTYFVTFYKYIYLHFLVSKLIDSHTVMQVENKKNHVFLYLQNVSSAHCLFDFHEGWKQHVIGITTIWMYPI